MKTYNEMSNDIRSNVRALKYVILIDIARFFIKIGDILVKFALRFNDYE